MPHVGNEPIPLYWLKIREKLEELNLDLISISDYFNICKSVGISDKKKARKISSFLHDLGVILHFQEDILLDNTLILNTKWATEAVYLVLLDPLVKNNFGKFDISDLERIWQPETLSDENTFYPKEYFPHLLQLMLKFQIAYQITDTVSWIIPQLLPENPEKKDYPNFSSSSRNVLHFEYVYPAFMPKGIISRLIVHLNKFIYKNIQWKSGVIFHVNDTQVEIIEDVLKREKIKIRIKGYNKKQALSFIRFQFEQLHRSFKALEIKQMIPCNCSECSTNDNPQYHQYSTLLKRIEKGKLKMECDESFEEINAKNLIGDVIEEDSSLPNITSINEGNLIGDFFEHILEKLLSIIYTNSANSIERGVIIKDKQLGKVYEYDFVVKNAKNREIIIVEAKGYNAQKTIPLGDYKTKETIGWFFNNTFPHAKKHIEKPEGYKVTACYVTTGQIEKDAVNEIEKMKKLFPNDIHIFYDRNRLMETLKKHGLNKEVKEIEKYYK